MKRPGLTAAEAPEVATVRFQGAFFVSLVMVAALLGIWASLTGNASRAPRSSQPPSQDRFGAVGDSTMQSSAQHPDVIPPGRHPRVHTGHTRNDGSPITVACGTCHATRSPNFETARDDELDEFHRGLRFRHGNLRCLACHDASGYDRLRLADGSALTFEDVMQLCAQCHGIQAKDFEQGIHGGMNGHWDRTRGTRVRHNCADCHDPHHPPLPQMIPTFKPRDRFLTPENHDNTGGRDER